MSAEVQTSARVVAREVVLWVGAVLGALSIIVFLLAFLLDARLLIVRSGSMEPAIATGSLAVAEPTAIEDLEVGDIVSVESVSGIRVTHRIVDRVGSGPEAALRLQGDANQVPDAEVYQVVEADRVAFAVPHAGRVVAASSTPPAMLAVGALVALILVLGFRAPTPPKAGRRKGPPTRSLLLVLGLATLTVPVVSAAPAFAAFTDTGAMGTGTFGAATIASPVASCAGLQVGSTNVAWTAVPGATGYRIFFGSGGSQSLDVGPTTTSRSLSGVITGGQFRVQALRDFGSTTWISNPSNTLNYTNLLFLVGTCS